ncbi:hypothetical protein, conserved [Entamoeba dispar SAW760]|uniref:Leucine rich repeat containing protein BspA family protein n=1 Tax=Entamoeba dispar (strain ATCC PRA-260 / SAW760) TaxID=370354 RepID=B0EHH9_ENTDS|nr:uncharacterized protein EDI_140750 [Entamoeba dispar SAW760]EDR26017.1 hypothetical protein, conserved [Entamoeba dispar SAW760]|eukprot:EDR26017.1 hypothetical protein, conserved [Entamoeba dispar SAW760]
MMIVSKYFNDIKDFINLEIGIKRYRGNMERFHFNPIPLNKYSRRFFPNIETFHIYNEEDEEFDDGRIAKEVIWYTVDYSRYLKEKEAGNICKNIKYTQYDRDIYGNIIPPEVKSLRDWCFKNCDELSSITIPTPITKLGNNCFGECTSLKTINIPTSINEIGCWCFEGCKLLTSITIPSTITEIRNNCFCKCSSLKTINIPSSISKIGNCCFGECKSLTLINIPSSISKIGNEPFEECKSLIWMNIDNLQFISKERIFMNEPVLISIKIPENLQIINGKNIFKKDINEFIIPSSISKLGDSCFFWLFIIKIN